MRNNKIKVTLGIMLGVSWALIVYFPPANVSAAADMVGFIKLALGGLWIHKPTDKEASHE